VSRTRLPDRRRHDVAEIEHGGFRLTVGSGRFTDGRLGEVFIDSTKIGTALDTILRDCAVLTSLALQAGIGVSTIRAAVANNGAIAAVLDHIGDES
jgi:ribonucleoside-diphosphate reductase alpha chain